MSELKVITDRKWKQFKYRNEVPKRVLAREFDYQDGESDTLDGFFCYRKRWYHLDGFMCIDKNSPFPKQWNGYASDSFFSGVLIEVSHDGETYRVGTYIG